MKFTTKIKSAIALFCFSSLLSIQVLAASDFVVKKIDIEGLRRISRGTVLNYLPVRVGQTLKSSQTPNILSALYKTGFFSSIQIDRQANVLVIKVTERPTIGTVTISGNKMISTKALQKTLKGIGIGQGLVYNESTLDDVKQSLQREYYDQGNYNATVDTVVTPASENRVNIAINISEGPSATIKQIKVIGNHKFKEKELLKVFKLKKKGLLSFFSKDDQYSREKLDGDLESLKSFYMDHGYIKFKVNSTHVSLSPDKKHVFIVVNITEGDQYRISGYKIAGKLIRPMSELQKLVVIKPNEVFSRKDITTTTTAIGNDLGNYGYIYAQVKPIPEVNDKNRTVFVTFLITPSNLYYVRHVTFTGNTKTLDHVLRNAVHQQESAQANLSDIQDSEHQLNLLGFIKGVSVKNKKVPGTDDQVDVDFHVTERPTATLTAGAGYSDSEGLLLNASYNQPNFLGTGKSISLGIGRTDYQKSASFSYFNPYFTDSGIGRGFTIYGDKTDYNDNDDVNYADYTTDDYGFSMNFSIPIAEYKYLNLGIGYQMTILGIGGEPSDELLNFFNGTNDPVPFAADQRAALTQEFAKKRKRFNNVVADVGLTTGSFDRAILPTKGFMQSFDVNVAMPGGGENLEYYTVDYTAHWYQPLFKGFIFSARADMGYGGTYGGTDEFPFFRNYNAGGIGVQGAVRGYDAFTLGPTDSTQRRLGGNFLASGSLGLILPRPLSGDSFRTSVFTDFGNVYNETNINTTGGAGPMRFSAGIALDWQSPMGPLEFSLARAINPRKTQNAGTPREVPEDDLEPFQFTVSTAL